VKLTLPHPLEVGDFVRSEAGALVDGIFVGASVGEFEGA